MISINIKSNDSIKDSLYQWDKNQVLEIRGLSLPKVPEVHFINDAIDRAIPRQASMDAEGTITVDVPNSLLQKPYVITAYVCIYNGVTFETLYKVIIPVKGRNKPCDYTIEDDIEIYSFNALENKLDNAVKTFTIDNERTIQEVKESNKKLQNDLKSDVAKEVAEISGRLDNVIAHNNSTNGNSELIDVRTDVNGKTHASAGAAVRGQVGELKSDLDWYVLSKYEDILPKNWLKSYAQGSISESGVINETDTTRFYTGLIPVKEGDVVRAYYVNGATNPAIWIRTSANYNADGEWISKGIQSATTVGYTVPSGVSFIRLTSDWTYVEKAMVTINHKVVTNEKYEAYFEPYSKIVSDFLTEETRETIEKIKESDNKYACALPRMRIYQTVGIPENFYYDSAVTPKNRMVDMRIGEYGYRRNGYHEMPNTTVIDSVNGYKFNVYDENLNIIDTEGSSNVYGFGRTISDESISDCSLLVIGDSTVDHDIMTAKIKSFFAENGKEITLLGTLGDNKETGNNNEGRAGWKTSDYFTNKQYDGVVNPFFNPTTETFDFSYYMIQQGYSSVDFVVIQLGINDLYNTDSSYIEPTWNNVKVMIDSIHAFNADIKVILNLPTTPNSDQTKHTVFEPLYRNRVIRYCEYATSKAKELYATSKVRVSYCHLILNPDTEIRDNVHPTNEGYEKMALEVVNQINNWQN